MSLTVSNIAQIIADNFFGGDVELAGLVLFTLIIVAIFVIVKNIMVGFIAMLPLTLVFRYMGMIPDTMMIILIVISVLGIAISSRRAVGGDL